MCYVSLMRNNRAIYNLVPSWSRWPRLLWTAPLRIVLLAWRGGSLPGSWFGLGGAHELCVKE